MAKGIIRAVIKVRDNVSSEIAGLCGDGSDAYASGLASEGYAGGYLAALDDVLLALNGVTPNRSYWRREVPSP